MTEEEHTTKETYIDGYTTPVHAKERAPEQPVKRDGQDTGQDGWLTAIAQLTGKESEKSNGSENVRDEESLGNLFEEPGTAIETKHDKDSRKTRLLSKSKKKPVAENSPEPGQRKAGDTIDTHAIGMPAAGPAKESSVHPIPPTGNSAQPFTKTPVAPSSKVPAASPAAKTPRPVFDPKTGKPVQPGVSPTATQPQGSSVIATAEKPAEPGKKGLRGMFGGKKDSKKDTDDASAAAGPVAKTGSPNPASATTIITSTSSGSTQKGKPPVKKPVFDSKTGKPVADAGAAGGSASAIIIQAPSVAVPGKKVQIPGSKQKFDPKTGKPIYTPVSSGAVPSLKGPAAGLSTTPGNGNGSGAKTGGLFSIFKKKMPHIMHRTEDHRFDVGYISEPSPEGAFRDVNLTYLVEAPFQYVHIEFDNEAGELHYRVVEPVLGTEELENLGIIERAFEKMISTNLDLIEGGHREEYLRDRFSSIISIFNLHVTPEQDARIFFHLKKQYLGYGRIDTLMKDKYIEDISCNGSNLYLYVLHRIYGSVKTDVIYEEVELNNFVLKLAQISGRHVSLLQPIRDVTLPDGSRANLTLGSEVTKKGSTFTIRKFRSNPISPIEMMDYQSVDAQQLAYLWILMEYKRSILVSGGTATGKTTFLNVLCAFIPDEYKIVSIEDTAELNLMHPNWIESVTRMGFGAAETVGASGVSGISRKAPGDISLYDLLVAALRQRPEFIIVGEVRGEEAFTLFQAIAVGHAALGTIHAGSMNELLARIESNPMNVPRSLFSNLDAVIFPMHIKKGERSMRRVSNIVEILELDRESGDLITNTSYKWVPETDVFKFQGRTFLFDKIKDTFGISKDLLFQELNDRSAFLNWLQKHHVRDYQAVQDMIRLYYRDKPEVMRRMGGKDHPLGSEHMEETRVTGSG